MQFDSQVISRCLFLFFIVCIAVYFMFVNKNITREGYEDNLPKDKDALTKTVTEILNDLYPNNPPSQKLVGFYVDYATQRVLTRDDLMEVIQGSAPALERTFKESGSQPATTAYGTEDEVTEFYKEILLRNPDANELAQYAKLLKEDPNFNTEKLKQLLYASEEYKRLEKTQTNAVYSNLMGGVTDRQLTLMVTTYCKQVTGQDNLDNDTISFLKKKLLSLNLDEVKFKDFLDKYMKGEKYTAAAPSQTTPAVTTTASGAENAGGVSKEDLDKFKQQVLDEVRQSMVNQPNVSAEQNSAYTDQSSGQMQSTVQPPNKQVIEILLKTAKDNEKDTYLDSQNVMNTIKDQAKCVFDKNAEDNYYRSLGPNSALAALQDKRNTDDLRSTCIRNKKYLGVDEDMVLDPSQKWTVPQKHPPVCVGGKNDYQPTMDQTALIGTLLKDAEQTDVGSILPPIPPR